MTWGKKVQPSKAQLAATKQGPAKPQPVKMPDLVLAETPVTLAQPVVDEDMHDDAMSGGDDAVFDRLELVERGQDGLLKQVMELTERVKALETRASLQGDKLRMLDGATRKPGGLGVKKSADGSLHGSLDDV